MQYHIWMFFIRCQNCCSILWLLTLFSRLNLLFQVPWINHSICGCDIHACLIYRNEHFLISVMFDYCMQHAFWGVLMIKWYSASHHYCIPITHCVPDVAVCIDEMMTWWMILINVMKNKYEFVAYFCFLWMLVWTQWRNKYLSTFLYEKSLDFVSQYSHNCQYEQEKW